MTTTMKPPTGNETAEIPASAFQLTGSPMQFMGGHEDADARPFSLVARSLDAIEHPWWGRIVHDMEGMQLRKPTCPVDYCHDPDNLIGVANGSSVTEDGLEVSGELIVLEANDEADKVFKRGKAGLPYEASIDWIGEGTELEYIPEDVTTEVNGRQFEGPGYVVRQWPLRSVAVCPYGADSSTSTQFAETESDAVSVRVFTESATESNDSMKKETTEKKDVPDEAKQLSDDSAKPAQGVNMETLKQFNDAFGDKAMEYLTAGLTFDAARLQFAEHRADTAEANAKKFQDQSESDKKALVDAQEKLKQFGDANGQEAPIDGDSDGGEPKTARIFSGGKAVRKAS